MATRELSVTMHSSAPSPCFFHRRCGNTAETEKQGKTLCRPCASEISADEFPLREPTREPLYWSANDLVRQMDMQMPRSRGRAGHRSGGRPEE
ncbi:MAG TPA: hypothetical protein VNJ12_06730 [Candidatus Dormibacteraeota bacterium]|nr:hypothetical protein [Candidatus Dormibacteraeota bacterium]